MLHILLYGVCAFLFTDGKWSLFLEQTSVLGYDRLKTLVLVLNFSLSKLRERLPLLAVLWPPATCSKGSTAWCSSSALGWLFLDAIRLDNVFVSGGHVFVLGSFDASIIVADEDAAGLVIPSRKLRSLLLAHRSVAVLAVCLVWIKVDGGFMLPRCKPICFWLTPFLLTEGIAGKCECYCQRLMSGHALQLPQSKLFTWYILQNLVRSEKENQ